MPPQSSPTPFASELGSSIYKTASPTSTAPFSASTSLASSPDSESNVRNWSNYLYIVVIFSVILLLLGFLYQRKRRLSMNGSPFPRNRFQAFHTHHPSQSRDLSAVQANNRVWRNMRAGPFSHHARMDSTGSGRRPGTSSTMARSRVDLDEEVPPPYVVAEPERTLDRGPSTRRTRDHGPNPRTRGQVDLHDLSRGSEGGGGGGSISKPPEYEEMNQPTRRSHDER